MSAIVESRPAPDAAPPAQGRGGLTLTEFYRALLPASGMYALFSVPRERHIWVDNLELLVKATERVSSEADWYFAVGSFTEQKPKPKRTQEFCAASRASGGTSN